MMNPKILVIDPDPAIQRLLSILLEGEHFRVSCERTGRDGLARASAFLPDLVILDLKLPGCDSFSVLGELRRRVRTPVMVLTPRSSTADIVKALDEGACDVVLKPFNGAEMTARVRAHLRSGKAIGANILISESHTDSAATRDIFVNGLKLELTAKEESILQILARNSGNLVTIHQLLNTIWGCDGVAQLHELRVYITRLRRKFEACGLPDLIESERNIGYSLSVRACREPVA